MGFERQIPKSAAQAEVLSEIPLALADVESDCQRVLDILARIAAEEIGDSCVINPALGRRRGPQGSCLLPRRF